MPVVTPNFQDVEWRRITDPAFQAHRVDFEYSLLGYDLPTKRIDMLLRYAPGGGHCRRHRHIAATATLVLEGDQFLTERLPDGRIRQVHRRKGDYALAPADAHPHDEHGGDGGGTVLLSMTAPDGILFEYFDADWAQPWTVSIEEFVDAWHGGAAYGTRPAGT
jgi:hypothetical protein